MKILFLAPYVPNRIRTRSYHLIRGLSDHGHEVCVVTIVASREDQSDVEHLKSICASVHAFSQTKARSMWNCVKALPTRTPLQAVYSWSDELMRTLLRLVQDADIVHIEHLRAVRYGMALRSHLSKEQRNLPLIWDSVDSISYLFQQATQKSSTLSSRLITRLELPRTMRTEAAAPKFFDRVLVTSQKDKEAFLALQTQEHLQERFTVLPNGVDLDYFKPDPEVPKRSGMIVITGKMSYHANVTMALHFIREVFPLVKKNVPDAEVWIVGRDPTSKLKSLAGESGVRITGAVTDINLYLKQACVAVAPIQYGAGIQNKVLEAMACGTPVVCSPLAASPRVR